MMTTVGDIRAGDDDDGVRFSFHFYAFSLLILATVCFDLFNMRWSVCHYRGNRLNKGRERSCWSFLVH